MNKLNEHFNNDLLNVNYTLKKLSFVMNIMK